MKKLIFTLIIIFSSLSMFAFDISDNEVQLGNVTVSRQSTTFSIMYDLSFGDAVKSCEVNLMISADAGKTYKSVDSVYLTGDFGTIDSDGKKTVRYDFSQDKEKLANKQILFKIDIVKKEVSKKETAKVKQKNVVENNSVFIAGQVAPFPHISYGAMAGMVKKFGFYAKFRSDFKPTDFAYSYQDSNKIFWGTENKHVARMTVTGGFILRVQEWLYPYIGAGYGNYGLYCTDNVGKLAKNENYSVNGVSLDAGALFRFGRVALTAGISNTMFKYTEAEIGVGIFF